MKPQLTKNNCCAFYFYCFMTDIKPEVRRKIMIIMLTIICFDVFSISNKLGLIIDYNIEFAVQWKLMQDCRLWSI